MLYNISPSRQNPREEPSRSERTKPQGLPPNDNFRKSMGEKPPSKEEQEHSSTVKERKESVFELSRSKKKDSSSLTQSNLKNSKKDSASRSTSHHLHGKERTDENQDQDFNLSSSQEEADPSTIEDSLFATADEQPIVKEEVLTKKIPPDQLQQQAAAALHKPRLMQGSDKKASLETNKLGQTSKKQKSSKSEASAKGEMKGETTSVVNASIQAVGFQIEKAEETQEVVSSATIRELATQIIDRVQLMRRDNETQTTITLRNPPILEGATITLTASDHAKREFNISFANLSPDAKLMLDRKFKEDSLTEILERKGIIVHMLTTSTQAESILTADAEGQTFRDRQEQQQQRRQNFQETEEEDT